MGNIVDFVPVQEVHVHCPGGICDDLIHPPAYGSTPCDLNLNDL